MCFCLSLDCLDLKWQRDTWKGTDVSCFLTYGRGEATAAPLHTS